MDFEQELSQGIRCELPKDLALAAERLAHVLPLNLTLNLIGPMGAGKTFLASHMAKALGVQETLKSPTYDIVSSYLSQDRNIVHLDAFRIESTNDLELLGLEELLAPPWLLLVEWPDRIPEMNFGESWNLSIEVPREGGRLLSLNRCIAL